MTNNTPDYEDNLYFDAQNTKNEQQKDLCITSEQLTEQWKKGEGLYWVKHDGVINILDNLEISLTNVEQILGEVPSYDEWQASYNCMAENEVLRLKNAQLKELLKECQYILKEQNFYRNTSIETDTAYRTRCLKKYELLDKIDEVLQ